jgi:hypothetical protein
VAHDDGLRYLEDIKQTDKVANRLKRSIQRWIRRRRGAAVAAHVGRDRAKTDGCYSLHLLTPSVGSVGEAMREKDGGALV